MTESNDHKSSEVRMRVPFHDCDPMRIVWHGHYLKYFEVARDALLAECDVNLLQVAIDSGYLFPIIRSSIKHILPLKYQDDFICRATLIEARRKIVLEFEVIRESDGKRCVKGRTEQMGVIMETGESILEIPADIRNRLGFE